LGQGRLAEEDGSAKGGGDSNDDSTKAGNHEAPAAAD
jgi:hypothetical protein